MGWWIVSDLLRYSVISGGLKPSELKTESGGASGLKLFLNTYMVTALNPKGIIFFVAFLPQFINHGVDVTVQLWILAATFVALATLNATLYAMFASKAQTILSSAKAQKRFYFSGGVMLSIAGLWTLSAKGA